MSRNVVLTRTLVNLPPRSAGTQGLLSFLTNTRLFSQFIKLIHCLKVSKTIYRCIQCFSKPFACQIQLLKCEICKWIKAQNVRSRLFESMVQELTDRKS